MDGVRICFVACVVSLWVLPASAFNPDPIDAMAQAASPQSGVVRDANAEALALDFVSTAAGGVLRASQQRSQERLAAMARLVEQTVDWGFVMRNSIPPDAMSALSDIERQVLARSMLAVSASEFATTFNGYHGEKIDVVTVNSIGPGLARVQTNMRGPRMAETVRIDWIVAGLDEGRPSFRDLVIDGTSMLSNQQQVLRAMWEEVGHDKAKFLRLVADPYSYEGQE